jgi:hypothetical protein
LILLREFRLLDSVLEPKSLTGQSRAARGLARFQFGDALDQLRFGHLREGFANRRPGFARLGAHGSED